MSPYSQFAGQGSPYWDEVNVRIAEIREGLPKDAESVFITSLEDRRKQMVGGRVFETDFKNAAQRLTERSHRLSTPEEIKTYRDHDKREAMRLAALEEARKNTMTIKPSSEDNERLATIISTAVGAVMDAQKKK